MHETNVWTSFWRSVVRVQIDKINPWIALRNTIGLAVPLAVGVALGEVSAGLAVATGALNVAFRDSSAPYLQRARLLLLASLVAGLAVFAGGVSGSYNVAFVVIAGAWAFGAGMLVALGADAADLGVMSLVMLLVYASSVRASQHAVYAGMLAFGGGLMQTALSLVFWPVRRYVPERRALGDLYLALAHAAAGTVQALPATAQSIAAHNALAGLDRDDSMEGARYRSLLSQAERIRLSLLAGGGRGLVERVLMSIGNALLADEQVSVEELHALAAGVPDQALAGQLRAAAELAANATTAGAAAFKKREAARPWRLRVGGRLATLRANMSLDSSAFRHALRLAACVAIGDAAARASNLGRAYWLPMTVAIVLKPDFAATFSRGVLRMAGTFVGLIFSTALFHALPPGLGAQVAAITALMFVLRCFGAANYGILVTALTALVVLLVAMSGVTPKEVITERAWSTLAGGGIALIAYGLWPTWERTQVSETIARVLDAFRAYFHRVRECYVTGKATGLDRVRIAGRVARLNLEASIQRMRDEPGTSPSRRDLSASIVAGVVRLAHALLALEARLYEGSPAPEGFLLFANQVELTLHSLAAALRGSPLTVDQLPELRTSTPPSDPEADRITNSLDTLGEELLRWIGQEPAR